MISYGRHWIDEDDISAVVSVLRSGDNIADGPKALEFEKRIAEYLQVKYAVVVSSGTAALHAACYVGGIREGDEVITSPNTFVSTVEAILYCGGKPIFADIDEDTHNISVNCVREKITPRTKAILPVDYAGQPCDMEELQKIAKENELLLIEDGAESIGSVHNGKKIGTFADMTIFSFHAVKNITTCEGGAIVTDNEEYYKELCRFRAYGIDKGIVAEEEPWLSRQMGFGFNYRLSEIQCALGISQLRKLDKFIERRTEIAGKYYDALKDCKKIKLPYIKPENKTNWYMFAIQVCGISRRMVWEALKDKGILAGVSFYPVYKNPYYQKNGYQNVYCIESEKFYDTVLILPCFPKMSDNDVEKVITVLKCVCAEE